MHAVSPKKTYKIYVYSSAWTYLINIGNWDYLHFVYLETWFPPLMTSLVYNTKFKRETGSPELNSNRQSPMCCPTKWEHWMTIVQTVFFFICACIPTDCDSDELKDELYRKLSTLLKNSQTLVCRNRSTRLKHQSRQFKPKWKTRRWALQAPNIIRNGDSLNID